VLLIFFNRPYGNSQAFWGGSDNRSSGDPLEISKYLVEDSRSRLKVWFEWVIEQKDTWKEGRSLTYILDILSICARLSLCIDALNLKIETTLRHEKKTNATLGPVTIVSSWRSFRERKDRRIQREIP
jgi:hypothetical protein